MESVIKWQTGEPKEEGEYLVTLFNGEITFNEYCCITNSDDEEEFDCEEICGNCDYVNGFNYEENGSRIIICKNCGEEILLCSLCDPDEVDCDECPYQK